MDWIVLYIIAGILLLPTLLYGAIIQNEVNVAFEKYSKTISSSEITASELCKKLLSHAGINNVSVERIKGTLTDNYNPRYKVIKLSNSTYSSMSISALGVCAHEVGHAIQDHQGNFLFRLRTFLAPVLSFISRAFIPLVLVGSIMNAVLFLPVAGFYVVLASVIFYGASLVFELVTLPLEFDASKKALQILRETDTLTSNEIYQTKTVLDAAAKTYIASTFTTLLYFLRFLGLLLYFTDKHKN